MEYEKKIKCVVAENGTILPIHNIAVIAPPECTHDVWTNTNCLADDSYRLSDEQYYALLSELEYIGGRFID